jgi:uncharacterized Zn-binding protein involved in type VI secretion
MGPNLFGGVSETAGIGNVSTSPGYQNIAERNASTEEMFWRFGDDLMFRLRVAIPAQVVSYNAQAQTIVAQPLIREQLKNPDTGKLTWTTIAQVVDVPVCFPGGGGAVLTFPLQAGDEVELRFQDLDIDSWWANGGIQNFTWPMRHDLSNAIAYPSPMSTPKTLYAANNNGSGASTTATELRTVDGTTKVSLSSDSINIVSTDTTGAINLNYGSNATASLNNTTANLAFGSNSVVINNSGIALNGNVTVNGNLTTNGTSTNFNSATVNINTFDALYIMNSLGSLYKYSQHFHNSPTVGHSSTIWDPIGPEA